MKNIKFEDIDRKFDEDIEIIFNSTDLSLLTGYEKRKAIFDYLCENLEYDYPLLDYIKQRKSNNGEGKRKVQEELFSAIFNHVGICNAIAQYYKLLLSKVGVYSACVICSDGTEIYHQLNLVFNKETDSYSLDDVTSVIVGRGDKTDFFDYDLEMAFNLNQGSEPVLNKIYWLILPDSWVYGLIGKKASGGIKISSLPSNIVSLKNVNSVKK